jgi:hypothetical protein
MVRPAAIILALCAFAAATGPAHAQSQKGDAAPATAPSGSGEPAALWVRPPALDADVVTRKLPAPANDVIPAAGGRLLLFRLKNLDKVAVFDVEQAHIAGYVSLEDCGDCALAAGADHLLAISRDHGFVRRWNLRTLKKELTAAFPNADGVKTFVMGEASAGPALALVQRQPPPSDYFPVTVDTHTLTTSNLKWGEGVGNRPFTWVDGRSFPAVASGDGAAFIIGGTRLRPRGNLIEWRNPRPGLPGHTGRASSLGYDGSLLFAGRGVFAPDWLPVAPRGLAPATYGAAHGSAQFFIALRPNGKADLDPNIATIDLYDSPAAPRRIATWDVFPEFAGVECDLYYEKDPIPPANRIHLYPSANLIVTLGRGNDQLTLRRFDVATAMRKSGLDFLYFESCPPPAVARGETWTYRPRYASSADAGRTLTVELCPPGLGRANGGAIQWTAPADFSERYASIVLHLADKSGHEAYQSFRILVR